MTKTRSKTLQAKTPPANKSDYGRVNSKSYDSNHLGRSSPVRHFDPDFKVSRKYRESLPDVMLSKDSIMGAQVAIQHVGISNFRVPLKVLISPQLTAKVECSVVGTVSLHAHLKGINMSRIMRSFYEFKNKNFSVDVLSQVLKNFKKDLGSESARLKVSFSFPLLVSSLRSRLKGYQYYEASFEALMDRAGSVQRFIELDFVYSSACPCSSQLAEHARQTRHVYGIPHSQRSKARLRIKLADSKNVSLLELRDKCLKALKTETQVMVKREDEQAFAELNGSHEKFVEDAARSIFEQLNSDKRIHDFEVICSHLESLHSHDAISAICKGIPGGMTAEFSDFDRLKC